MNAQKSNLQPKKKIRTIIIGCGFFGKKRLQACLDLPKDIEIVGIIDNNRDTATHLGQIHHVPYGTSIRDIKSENADFAIIAVPNSFHTPITIEALANGWHVLCEKPLATSSKDARRIMTAAKRYKRIVKTGSNHRFFHTVQKARELFDAGEIGKLLFFKGSVGTNGSRVSHKWFWDPSISGGGTFIDNGCHLLDIARMFMGNFATCAASMTNNLWKKAGVEDVGSAIYRTKDNRQAVITSSWLQWAGYLHIELWGEKGYIIIDSTTHDTVTVGGKDGIFTTYDYSNEKKDSYHRELLYLAHCIRNGIQPVPNARDGAAVIAMIEAAYKASQKHVWVPIT